MYEYRLHVQNLKRNFDYDFFSELFYVWNEADFCDEVHDDYYAKSSLFCGEASEEENLKIAGEILILLNGYLSLSGICGIVPQSKEVKLFKRKKDSTNFIRIQPRSLNELESIIPNYFLMNLVQKKSEALLGQVLPTKLENNLREGFPTFDILLFLATKKLEIYLLMRLFAIKNDWTNLYRIFETLKTIAQESNYPLEMTKREKNSFTIPANKFSITGLLSRHGYKKNEKDPTDKVFSLDQAQDFITKHVQNYIKWYIYKEFNVDVSFRTFRSQAEQEDDYLKAFKEILDKI